MDMVRRKLKRCFVCKSGAACNREENSLHNEETINDIFKKGVFIMEAIYEFLIEYTIMCEREENEDGDRTIEC